MKDDAFGFDDLTNPKPADGSGDGGSTGGAGGMNLSPSGMPSEDLLKDLQGSIEKMQSQMQSKYKDLSDTVITGESADKTIKIAMTAVYGFEDIDFDESAMEGGMKEFKWRLREAFRDVLKKIQTHTQAQTMDLLQGMQMPENLKDIGDGSGDGGQ